MEYFRNIDTGEVVTASDRDATGQYVPVSPYKSISQFQFRGQDIDFKHIVFLDYKEASMFVQSHRVKPAFVGPCDPTTPRCDLTPSMNTVTPECCRGHIRDVLFQIIDILEREGIEYWLDYGSLHGAVHNEGILTQDKDTDIGIWEHDLPRLLELKEEFVEVGYSFSYKHAGSHYYGAGNRVKVCRSEVNRNNCDIFVWYKCEDGTVTRHTYHTIDRYKGREFHIDNLLPLSTLLFEGREVSVPKNPEAFSTFRRGGRPWKEHLNANHYGVPV